MTARARHRRTTGLGVAALVAAGLAAVVPTAAHATPSPASSTAGDATSEVTLILTAPHPAALARLAAKPVTDRAARIATLATLVPSDRTRAEVVAVLHRDGLTLDHETAWSVTMTGPQVTLTSLFGTRPAGSTGLLPKVPAALTDVVAAVYPTTGGPAAFAAHETSTLSGTDFRRADTPAHVRSSTGEKDQHNTVATLQLSNVPASDITHYADVNKLPDPVAAGRYQPVTVDGGPGPSDSAGENSIEVDLDQESILSTAPSATQSPYFGPNTDAGFDDIFANVYDDVVGNKMATRPNPHLTALSSSWGECEGQYGKANIVPLEPIIESVVAAGVTVFASSGDDGIYDCRSTLMTGTDNEQADVDFPASSPYVISTGGSNLSAATSADNTGTNWVEKTWSCATDVACQNAATGSGGGGGGASGSADGHTYDSTPPITADFAGWAMPLYQRKTLHGIYGASKTRLVPDIVADGDPETGFSVYTTLDTGVTGESLTVGGTSLASPISAAQLTNTLGDAGVTHGVGDIHPAVYSAYARTRKLPVTSPKRPIRDVTVGKIGATADRGSDPSVAAAKGYDTTSGVGGILWRGLLPYLLDKAAPTPYADPMTHHVPRHRSGTVVVPVRWKTTHGKDPLVFDRTEIGLRKAGTKKVLFVSHALRGTTHLRLEVGARYTIKIASSDIGGHVSKIRTVTFTVPERGHHPHDRHRH